MWVFRYACGEYSTVSDGTDLQNNHMSAHLEGLYKIAASSCVVQYGYIRYTTSLTVCSTVLSFKFN
jgi:hypothetical protein